MDRANVGGSQSGSSPATSRAARQGNNKWSIDGVDITDMSATGSSPMYYDFDMLEEMQVTTGGADASQQTGGVGINLVTRGGTDRFKGSGRFLVTDDSFQADNINDELRAQGAGSGSPIQNIQDYGFEVGGPIKRGKAWFWGSYGTQDIKVGVVGFYKDTATCRPTPPTDTSGAARLSRDRPDHARQLQLEGHRGTFREQPLRPAEHVGRQSEKRAGCVRHAPERNDLSPEEHRLALRHVRLELGPGPDLEGERSARVFGSVPRGRPMGARRQQLHPRFPRRLALRRPAEVRDVPLASTSVVPAVGFLPADQQLRPHVELLPAELHRRRPRVQGRPPLEERSVDQPEPSRRQRLRPLYQRRAELGSTCGATAIRSRTSTPGRSTRRTATA